MNVAYLTNVVYPFVRGGAQKRIHEIGRRLAADGHAVTVYGRHYWDGPAVAEHAGMTLHAVGPARELYAGDRRSIPEAVEFGARVPRALRWGLRHRDHDVVVASVFPYFPVPAAWLAGLGTGTPLVTTWHEVWDDYWGEYLGRPGVAGRAVERVVARVPQHPVAVSGVTADALARIGPDRDSIAVVPNGIDVAAVRGADPVPPGEAHDVVSVGRLTPAKNVDTLLRAFARVATGPIDACVGADAGGADAASDAADADAAAGGPTLGVVGDGPERERLTALAADLGVADRVTFHGELDADAAVYGHLRAADVFASASTREGFGIAVVEAMAADCTVVAADAPDSAAAEVLGDAGLLAAPTVEGMAEALGGALRGDRPAGDPVARAREYDWDAVADRALSAYRRATGE